MRPLDEGSGIYPPASGTRTSAAFLEHPRYWLSHRLFSVKKAPKNHPVSLTFDLELHPDEEEFHYDLSACAIVGDDLWLGSDELTSLERLSRGDDGNFGEHKSFPLSDYVDLPSGDEDEEVDIEGIVYADHCLWVTGSHSLKRQKTDGAKPKKAIKNLAGMVRETNRYLIARIPVVHDPEAGRSELFKTCVHPDDPEQALRAAQLFGTGGGNMLTEALRLDDHLGRFLSIPCKENGLDIEGIAVVGDRSLLGLRGPVLRGWSIVVEIEMEEICEHTLRLVRIGPHKRPYRKHFLDLQGLGIRDMCSSGEDLLLLAGPTMDLEGPVRVLRWKDIADRQKESIARERRTRGRTGFHVAGDRGTRPESRRGVDSAGTRRP